MSCDEIPGLKLHDGATRIFLNTHGTDEEGVSEELIQLLRYFEQTTEENAAGSHSRKIEKLQKRVEEIKKPANKKKRRSAMKIVIINGSARKGNTLTAINTFIKGAAEHNEIEMISPDKLHIAPCKGCKACQCHKGCVDQDDTNPTIDKIAAADMILFATPVYWWGMTAQLKLVIDKCYCRGLQLKGKKVGIIVTGGAPVDNVQYELIRKQFECMAGYLSWEVLFFKTYSANAKDELEKNTEAMEELEKLGQDVK